MMKSEPTRVSQGGGITPFWSPDGNMLYYAAGSTGPFLVAHIGRDPVPQVLSTDSLFSMAGGNFARPFQGSALHPDGDRFVMAGTLVTADARGGAPEPARLILVLNFHEELKRLGVRTSPKPLAPRLR